LDRVFSSKMRINIIPIGNINQEVLSRLKLNLKEIFFREIEISPQMEQPAYAYNPSRKQFHSTTILSAINSLQLGGESLGIVDVDLYAFGLNFVFGEADPQSRVGIISLYRLRPELYGLPQDEELFIQRAIKEAIHELGHIYGLRHCPDVKCVMHFSNTLRDTDIKQAAFCTKCSLELKRKGVI